MDQTPSISFVRAAVERKQTSASALAESYYKKIESDDKEINAYLTLHWNLYPDTHHLGITDHSG